MYQSPNESGTRIWKRPSIINFSNSHPSGQGCTRSRGYPGNAAWGEMRICLLQISLAGCSKHKKVVNLKSLWIPKHAFFPNFKAVFYLFFHSYFQEAFFKRKGKKRYSSNERLSLQSVESCWACRCCRMISKHSHLPRCVDKIKELYSSDGPFLESSSGEDLRRPVSL